METNQLSLSKPSKPSKSSQFNISAPVFVPPPQVYVPLEQQQGPIGLCVTCNQFQNLATIHNPPFFEDPPSSSALIMGKRRNRPAPPQRHDVVMRWKNYFGAGHLEDWQRLCSDLGLAGDLPSKNKCRQALRSINVNIWDFLDAIDVGGIPQMFLTKKRACPVHLGYGTDIPKRRSEGHGARGSSVEDVALGHGLWCLSDRDRWTAGS